MGSSRLRGSLGENGKMWLDDFSFSKRTLRLLGCCYCHPSVLLIEIMFLSLCCGGGNDDELSWPLSILLPYVHHLWYYITLFIFLSFFILFDLFCRVVLKTAGLPPTT